MRFAVRFFWLTVVASAVCSAAIGGLCLVKPTLAEWVWWLPFVVPVVVFLGLCFWFALLDLVSMTARYAVSWNRRNVPRWRPSRAVRRQKRRR